MVWDILHYSVKGGVYIEMRVVLIEFGVVFIGGRGHLTIDIFVPTLRLLHVAARRAVQM